VKKSFAPAHETNLAVILCRYLSFVHRVFLYRVDNVDADFYQVRQYTADIAAGM
jgi:hypothetical protein